MAIIRDTLEKFDNTKELEQAQREAIETLAALGESKADTFTMEIEKSLTTAGEGSNLTVPISTIVNSTSRVHAITENGLTNAGDKVKDALNKFVGGTKEGIIDGVGNLITDALGILLGTGVGNSGTLQQYYVLVDQFSVLRLDMKAWYMHVRAESLRKRVQSVTAVTCVKSVVDLSKVDVNTLLYLYQSQLLKGNVEENELLRALDEVRIIYERFQKSKTGEQGSKGLNNATQLSLTPSRSGRPGVSADQDLSFGSIQEDSSHIGSVFGPPASLATDRSKKSVANFVTTDDAVATGTSCTPSLNRWYGSLRTNQSYRIQAKFVIPYVTVGHGEFSTLTPCEVAFSGQYEALGQSGKVDVRITVDGNNTGSFQFNDKRGRCRFQVHGDYLYVIFSDGGTERTVELQWWHDGLWIGGDAVPYKIWIG